MSRDLRALVFGLAFMFARSVGAEYCEYFVGTTKFDIGSNPVAIAAFPYDGDVAVATGTTVRIALGHQEGHFTRGREFGLGGTVTALVLADFNGDHHEDLAGGTVADEVSIRLTNEWGSLVDEPAYHVSDSPAALIAIDVDGDSDLDLAVANRDADTVSTLLNDGSGTFVSGSAFSVGTAPTSLAGGDVDADGDVDLVTGNSATSTISVLRNDGSGHFTVTNVTTGANAAGVAAADFDGDGDADLAVTASTEDRVLIFRSNGDGSFETPVEHAVGDNPGPVMASDLDADGRSDLTVVNRDSDTFTLLFGEEGGTFGRSTQYGAGENPSAVVSADLNDDGVIDLAIPSRDSYDLRIFFGVGGGVFTSHFGPFPDDVITADFNRDGHADFASAGDELLVLTGKGDGTFDPPIVLVSGVSFKSLATGFFTDDEVLDLAAARFTGVHIFPGLPEGGFGPPIVIDTADDLESVVVDDFDRDGEADLALGAADIWIYRGNGDGTFDPGVNYVIGSGISDLVAGDFDADGYSDLAVTADQLTILPNTGDGTFGTPVSVPSSLWAATLATGDFNGDSALDLVVGDRGTPSITVYLGSENGSFSGGTPLLQEWYKEPRALLPADITGDGHLDLAIALDHGQTFYRNIGVLPGNGDGTFDDYMSGHVSSNWATALAAADFDEDGAPDLVVAESQQTSVVFSRPECASIVAISPTSGAPAGGQSVTITGSNLLGARSVAFGGVPATITANTPTSITVTTPAHPAALVSIEVQGAGGRDVLANAYVFEGIAPQAPSGMLAVAASASRVDLQWGAVPGATSYIVERKAAGADFTPIHTVDGPSYTDTTAEADRAYLYRVRAANDFGLSNPSAHDLATTVMFIDAPLYGVRVKAEHLSQIRTAVNAVRLLANLAPAVYTDADPAGVIIRAVHLIELRQALRQARYALGVIFWSYTDSDSSLERGIVRARHVEEIRQGMK